MTSKVFSFVSTKSETSIVASVRIARFVARELEIELTDDQSIADEPLDVLLIVNGAFAFCKHLEPLSRAIRTAQQLVWVENDYTIVSPKPESAAESPFRAAFRQRRDAGLPDMLYWTTVRKRIDVTGPSGTCYINWNCLTFDPVDHDGSDLDPRCALAYYGSFRTGRERYFDRYFRAPTTNINLSSPSQRKFMERFPSPKIEYQFVREGLDAWLARQWFGLYVEDRRSHDEFHSPANRFYEMLAAGLPMVFQPEAQKQLALAGYDVGPYVVGDSQAVAEARGHRHDFRAQQAQEWFLRARCERDELGANVRGAWHQVEGRL